MKKNYSIQGRDIRLESNLFASLTAGLVTGLAVGFVMGFKVAVINPSMTIFKDVWLLVVHLMALYGIAGTVIGGILGFACYPFLRKNGLKNIRSLFNLYLPAMMVIGLFYYIRSYILSHFVTNPALALKGAGWIDLGITIILIALMIPAIRLTLKICASWRLDIITGLGGGAALVIWTAAGLLIPQPQNAPKPEFEEYNVTPNKAKVAVIAIDGAWWKVIDPLLQAGKLPNFQRLIENGTRGDFKTLYPTFSPMIWSSISTGKLPQKHGINSFFVWTFPVSGVKLPFFRLPAMAPELLWAQENVATVAPIPSNYRTASAIWSILSGNDKSVGVISWFTSWPAEKVTGYMLSDRALFTKMDVLTNYKSEVAGSSQDIYPPELTEEVEPFSFTPKDMTYEDLTRFVNVENDGFWDEFQKLDTYDYIDIAYEASMFKFSYPSDKTIIGAAEYLLANKPQPDFWAVYLQGMDSMQHQYLKYHFPANYDKLLPVNTARYKDLITRYYEYMDETLGKFTAALDSSTLVIVISDHGFDEMMLPTGHYNHVIPAVKGETDVFHVTTTHPGIFIASGPGIKKGYAAEDLSVLDLTPTILAYMNFPFAKDFDGKIMQNIFETPLTVDTIPTYDEFISQDRTIVETGADKGIRDKMKALGYVK